MPAACQRQSKSPGVNREPDIPDPVPGICDYLTRYCYPMLFSSTIISLFAGSMIGGVSVVSDVSVLLRVSLSFFLYYLSLSPRHHYAFWQKKLGLFRLACFALGAILFYSAPEIPFLLDSYEILVRYLGAILYCCVEAYVFQSVAVRITSVFHQLIMQDPLEVEGHARLGKGAIIGSTFLATGAAGFLVYLYVTSFDTLEASKSSPGAIVLPIIACLSSISLIILSLVLESGIISEAALSVLAVTYCLWCSRYASGNSHIWDWVKQPEFPYSELFFLALAVLVLSYVMSFFEEDTDSIVSNSNHSESYMFETEPFVKACLVLLGTAALGVFVGHFNNEHWRYWRGLQMILIPLFYLNHLTGSDDELEAYF